jgi:metallo-beta-lactamase family protein
VRQSRALRGIEATFPELPGRSPARAFASVAERRETFSSDCGLFQGKPRCLDEQERRGARTFDVRALRVRRARHACAIDHSGAAAAVCCAARGFSGPVYATPATIDLLGVMLPDSAYPGDGNREVQGRRRSDRAARRSTGDGHRRRGSRRFRARRATACTVLPTPNAACRLLRPRRDATLYTTPHARPAFGSVEQGIILGYILGRDRRALGRRRRAARKLVFSGDLGQPGRP